MAGFTGIVIPEEYGGGGKGFTELLIAMEELAAHGCGLGGAWYLILTEVFGGIGIVRHGTQQQKKRYLPGIAAGELEFCMALTEPDAGSNTLNTKTAARREGRKWIVNGSKTFINSHSCEIGISDLALPEDALIPPQDEGWHSILDTLNTERMSLTAAAIGIARLAMGKAIEYSKQRKVFGNALIGSHQALQVPTAEAYSALEAARLMNFKAAALFDNGAGLAETGAAANMAKVLMVENAIKATYWSMQVFGGYGYARDYDVESRR